MPPILQELRWCEIQPGWICILPNTHGSCASSLQTSVDEGEFPPHTRDDHDEYHHHHRDFLAVTVHQTKGDKPERRDRSELANTRLRL